MQVIVEALDGATVVAASGRVDSPSAPALARALSEAAALGRGRVVVDFSGVTYISSAGISVLLATQKRARLSGGDLILCGLPEGVREVLSLSGLLTQFAAEETREAALEFARHRCTPAPPAR